jgi:putative transposon-encoded protein
LSRQKIRQDFPRLAGFLCDREKLVHVEGIPCFVIPLLDPLAMGDRELSHQVEAYFESVSRYGRSARVDVPSKIGNVIDFIMNLDQGGGNVSRLSSRLWRRHASR